MVGECALDGGLVRYVHNYRAKGENEMSKLTVWIADQMQTLSGRLEAEAYNLYRAEFKDRGMNLDEFVKLVNENYNFDDDETMRTSDEKHWPLGDPSDLYGLPTFPADEGVLDADEMVVPQNYTIEVAMERMHREGLRLRDDGPNYEADNGNDEPTEDGDGR